LPANKLLAASPVAFDSVEDGRGEGKFDRKNNEAEIRFGLIPANVFLEGTSMNLPENTPSPLDRPISSTRENGSSSKRQKAHGRALRLASLVVTLGVILCVPIGSDVFAKTAPKTSAKTAHQADSKETDIDPGAMEALNKLGTYLRSLTAFQVVAEINTDDVLDTGQIIQSSKKVDLVAAKPNRLRAEITSDDEHRLLFFDGKNFTIYGLLVNFYATVPAPPTIRELIVQIDDKYGMEFPLVDLFKWGTDDADVKKIKSAIDVGPATVGGVTCEQYAFHQDGADWQIWIQLGEFPLPRKLVIRTLSDDARPQYSETLTWNLAPSFSDDAFTFDPPADAKRIAIAEVKAGNSK
jgi:hypothetical protein